jgi:hypothetical protein
MKYLLVDRQFKFDGLKNELVDSIAKVKGVSIMKVNDNKIKIYPWISIGTLVLKSGQSWIDGINVKAELADNDKGLTRIRLLTTLRPEHYFIAGVFTLFFLFLPLDKEVIYNLIESWLIAHIWFQIICRIQEELLVRKLINRLRLIKM